MLRPAATPSAAPTRGCPYTKVHEHAHCCPGSEVLYETRNGFTYRARTCGALCDSKPPCGAFSISQTWGKCMLCERCSNGSLTRGNDVKRLRDTARRYKYSAWERPAAAAAAACGAGTEEDSDAYLDAPLYKLIFRDHDIFRNLTMRKRYRKIAGWGSVGRPLYNRLISEAAERATARGGEALVIEVGVWMGATTAIFAGALHGRGKVLAVDTWLGALEMWERDAGDWSRDLHLRNGYPTVYQDFLSNMVHIGVHHSIIPFPAPSSIAAQFCQRHRILADLIHLDASHEYAAVSPCRPCPVISSQPYQLYQPYQPWTTTTFPDPDTAPSHRLLCVTAWLVRMRLSHTGTPPWLRTFGCGRRCCARAACSSSTTMLAVRRHPPVIEPSERNNSLHLARMTVATCMRTMSRLSWHVHALALPWHGVCAPL